jgi:hypothetical protein
MNKPLEYELKANKRLVVDFWNNDTQYKDLKYRINERFYKNLVKFSDIEYSENELLIIIDDLCKLVIEKISVKNDDLIEYILSSNLMQNEVKSLYKRLKSNQPIHDFELIELIFLALRNAGIECVTQSRKDSGIIVFNKFCFFCWVELFHHHVHSFIHYLFNF